MKRVGILAVLVLLALAVQAPTSAFADSSIGIIEGRIINGTADGPNLVDHEVMLQAYVNYVNSGEAMITQTDSNGEFKFEDLDTSGEYDYVVSVNYRYADYYSDRIVFDDGKASYNVDLQVFEATEIDDSLIIQMAGTVISPQGNMVMVTEYVVVENTGDKTYIGTLIDGSDERRATIQFPVPADVIELQAEAGFVEGCTIMGTDSIIDTLPLYPGLTEYSYSYSVQVTSDSYALVKSMDLPVETMIAEIADQGHEVLCDGLNQEASVERDSQLFTTFKGEEIEAGAPMMITINGLQSDSKGNHIPWLFWIPPGVVALCILAYSIIHFRKPSKEN
jgi:hypothetical protein